MRFKHYCLICFALVSILLPFSIFAQLSQGGTPLSFGHKHLQSYFDGIKLSPINVEHYLLEDSLNAALGDKTLRFGAEISVNLNTENSGTWELLPDGSRVWRLSIQSPGAWSLHANFSRFHLPEGARFFAFNRSGTSVAGAFTNANHNPDGNFAFMPIAGDELILELYEPKTHLGESLIVVESVVHAYRDFYQSLKNFGSSGACNINVNCPLGDNWQNQKRAVCMLLTANNTRFCSGALVNNTAQDGKPYILTARHCQPATNNIFMFNYESPTCENINGPTHYTIQGCVVRAQRSGSDFALVELNQTPPEFFDVFYAGWSRENVAPEFSVGIHHPSGDIKKISMDEHPATQALYGFPQAQCWRVGNWEHGTTEGGSSGSPLFDQNRRIIGQLFGGTASCNQPNEPDFYGRFDVSWDAGTTPATRLKEWLDPLNSGVMSINGLGEVVETFNYDIRLQAIISPNGNYCSQFEISPEILVRNQGVETITSFNVNYRFNNGTNQTFTWSGTLNPNSNINVLLPTVSLNTGLNQSFEVEISMPNGQDDENPGNNTASSTFSISEGFPVTLQLTTDNYANETSWRLIDLLNNNQILYSQPANTLANATTYTEVFCLSRGCYRFTIFDSFGDGICCGINGNGSYLLINHLGQTIAQGGQFTFSESTDFCIDTVLSASSLPSEELELMILPNPNSGIFQLQTNINQASTMQYQAIDMSGKIIISGQINQNQTQIDLSNFADGIYLLKVIHNRSIQTIKIIKNSQR